MCNPLGGFHHANRDTSSGFCFFNDIAIAIEYLRYNYHLKKFMIIDTDVHYANGTQDVYIEDNSAFSNDVVRFRFFRMIKNTPHEMRTRYCNINYDREIAIVGEINERGKRRILGVSRIIITPGQNEEAEYTLIVSDEWQRKELGSEFIDYTIEIARDKGLKKLLGVVLKDNTPMINLCKEKKFKIESGEPGEYKIEYLL